MSGWNFSNEKDSRLINPFSRNYDVRGWSFKMASGESCAALRNTTKRHRMRSKNQYECFEVDLRHQNSSPQCRIKHFFEWSVG